jgi:hypothetical protein
MESTKGTGSDATIAPRRRGKGTPAAKSNKGKRQYSMFDDSFFDDSTCGSTDADSSSDDSSSSTNDDDSTSENNANLSPGTASTVTTIRIESSQLQTQQSFSILESQQSPTIADTKMDHSSPANETTNKNHQKQVEAAKSALDMTTGSHSMNAFAQPILSPVSKSILQPVVPAERILPIVEVKPKHKPPKVSLSPSTHPNQKQSKVTKQTKCIPPECSVSINTAIDLTIDDTPKKQSDIEPCKQMTSKNGAGATTLGSSTDVVSTGFDAILNDQQCHNGDKSSDKIVEKKASAKKGAKQQQQNQRSKNVNDKKGKVDPHKCLTPSKRKMSSISCTEAVDDSKVAAKNNQLSSQKEKTDPSKIETAVDSEVKAPSQKKKKISFQDKVVSHMITSFKPFLLKTLTQIFQTSETTLEFLMLSLVDKNVVMKKEFTTAKGNRTKVLYWANYDSKSKECTVALPATDTEQKAAVIELEQTHKELSSVNNILANLLNGPSNTELTNQLQKNEVEVRTMKDTLRSMNERIATANRQHAPLSNKGTVNNNSKAAVALAMCPIRLQLRINAMRKEWKNRKEKCIDFIDQLADGLEKKPKDVITILDIETDEMYKAVMPPLYVIVEK